MSAKSVYDLLKGVELFSSLSEEQIHLLCDLAIRRPVVNHELIIREQDNGSEGFFLVAHGELEVFLSAEGGKETILSLMGMGDVFGEMSCFDDEPRSASVRTVSAGLLYQIKRDAFLQQLHRFPDLCLALMVELSRRLRKANRQIGSLSTLNVFGRVAGTLLNLIEERGREVKTENGTRYIVIPNRPTQQHLADMSGTTRETVSRILTTLKQKGAISMHGRDIYVLSQDALRQSPED